MLEIRGVSKSWNGASALTDVSFIVGDASYAVLLGASGSGKSTLLRAIAGLVEVDAGRIVLNGTDLMPLPSHLRSVSTVFQDYALFPHMTVAANIAFGLQQQGRSGAEIPRRVGEMLEIVGLPGTEQRMPTSLSGGQQQRVALARALAVQPRLVLLDEPLGALDAELRHSMRRELSRIQRESGVTFLHVSHDREEALSLADHLLVLHAGRLIGDGSPAALRENPGNARVAAVVGLDNALPDPDDSGTMLVFAPEHIVSGDGRWHGRVTQMNILGGTVECEIVTDTGHLIRQRSVVDMELTWSVGDEIRFDVPAHHLRRVRAD